jgi:hypothetical protein
MNAQELDHLVWRYEYGRLPESQLVLELRDELRRLFDVRATQGDPQLVERWSAKELLGVRDDALRAASISLTSRQYHEALRHLRKADEAMATIGRASDAERGLGQARDALSAVQALATGPSLQRMPVITSLVQLVDSLSVCMLNRRYAPASDLATLCVNIVSTLTARSAPGVAQSEASARIATLRQLCDMTRSFAGEHDTDPAADGSLEELQRLLADGHAALAMRLLAELEVALAARRRFRHHFLRSIDEATAHALRLEVRERSWDGAVDHDCQTAMRLQSAALERQAERVRAVNKSLGGAPESNSEGDDAD